jgi:hypothetical protein
MREGKEVDFNMATTQHNVSNVPITFVAIIYILFIYHTFYLIEECTTTTTTPPCYVNAASTAEKPCLL